MRRAGPEADSQTLEWQATITRLGSDGDWLVIRGYNSSDHLVALTTQTDLSHVGILDATAGEVVEAIGPAVRVVSLQAFLDGADRVVLVRPADRDLEALRDALAKARTQIGSAYDYLGTVGYPTPGEFYCSELAVWSIGRDVDVAGLENVIEPAALLETGTVLYDSRP